MISSLRLRVLIWTTLATATMLALLGVAIYFSLRQTLQSEFDEAILAQARALASMTEQHKDQVKLEFDADQMPEFQEKVRPEYFEVWIDGQGALGRSESLGGKDLFQPHPGNTPEFADTVLPDGRPGRSVSERFTALNEEDQRPTKLSTGVVTVSRDIIQLDHTLDRMGWMLLGLCTAAILVCGIVLMVVVSSAVGPMKRLAREIEAVEETDLAHRFDLNDAPQEMAPIVERLNELLARLDGAFARERAFTADAAHELRTPLAALRTTMEVCRTRHRESAEYEAAIDKCNSIAQHMQEMVQRLLLLARADSRQLTVWFGPLDLREMVENSWSKFRHRAEVRGLRVEWNIAEGGFVHSDRELLRIVIDNLFDNAVSHVNEGGVIEVTTARHRDIVDLVVRNSGSQVAAEDVPKVFSRFWRGDQSRTNPALHFGLGLSLCERLMRMLCGELAIKTQRGGVFEVRVRLAGIATPSPAAKAE